MNDLRVELRPLPDAAAQILPHRDGVIDWAGMDGIDLPILFDGGDGDAQRCPARAGFFVNLHRPDQRGIHMSRLYLLLEEHLAANVVNARTLESLLRAALHSQHGLADRARIRIRFDHLLRRRALRSDNHGWRAYPVSIEASLIAGEFRLLLGVEILYSSTCPASAALSRQVVQVQFARRFDRSTTLQRAAVLEWLGGESGIAATPHAQRSTARVQVRPAAGAPLRATLLIDHIEQALGTPVQTAVKREDEQAFAQANGENTMFCEDAVRRIARALDLDQDIDGFCVRVEHHESLHAHDAVACISRNMFDCSGFDDGIDRSALDCCEEGFASPD